MITPDKRIIENKRVDLTDYSAKCPKGLREFFVIISFVDESGCYFDAFCSSRATALDYVLNRFYDCKDYIKYISITDYE